MRFMQNDPKCIIHEINIYKYQHIPKNGFLISSDPNIDYAIHKALFPF